MERASARKDPLFHVEVQDATGWYWLHLEVAGTATMRVLDQYLRAIWLECCGHDSQWSLGRSWSGRTIPMSRKAETVLQRDLKLTHVYDFGTSTETTAVVVGTRTGALATRQPIMLMARNEAPKIQCMECERPAAWLCLECVHESGQDGGLCHGHVEGHPHDEYGEPMPVVNSPRIGMCGYAGPAEPPY